MPHRRPRSGLSTGCRALGAHECVGGGCPAPVGHIDPLRRYAARRARLQPSNTWWMTPVPRVSVRNSVRKPTRPRAGTDNRGAPSRSVVDHLDHRPLRRRGVGSPRRGSPRDVDRHALHWFVQLAVDLPGDDLGLATVSSKPRVAWSRRGRPAGARRGLDLQASGRSVGPTRSETLPISSASRRLLTRRAVSFVPRSGEGRRVDADRHGQARLVDRDGGRATAGPGRPASRRW